jgi:hypothetical protein
MAFGQGFGLAQAAFLLRGFLTAVVPGSRRAMHELAPGGYFETFRNGLLGLLHEMIPMSGAGQNKRRHRHWQGETAGRGW